MNSRKARLWVGLIICITGTGLLYQAEWPGVNAASPVSDPPTISSNPIILEAGQDGNISGQRAELARINDDTTRRIDLKVAITNVPNGITISGLFNGETGVVSAFVAVDCSFVPGDYTVRLTVTDLDGLVSSADLIFRATPHAPPRMSQYPSQLHVVYGGFTKTRMPGLPQTNSAGLSLTFSAPGYEGEYSLNPLSGELWLWNTKPAGAILMSVTATDGCGARTISSFTVVIGSEVDNCLRPSFKLQETSLSTGITRILPSGADFNSDGKADLVIAELSRSDFVQEILFLAGNGDGSFSAPETWWSGKSGEIKDLVAGDFNRDGKQDLAAVQDNISQPGRLIILSGDGKGGVSSPAYIEFDSNTEAQSLHPSDFNRDGITDLLVLHRQFETYPGSYIYVAAVQVFLGDGNGSFNLQMTEIVPVYAGSGALGDFNQDGNMDFAVLSNFWNNTLTVLKGDGRGAMIRSSVSAIDPSFGNEIIAADLDRDGIPDLIRTVRDVGMIAALKGSINPSQDYTFGSPRYWNADRIPARIVAADFNGDRNTDLFIVSNDTPSAEGGVHVFTGDGQGGFCAVESLRPDAVSSSYPGSYDVGVGDFNNDGKPDPYYLVFGFLSSPDKLRVFLNTTDYAPVSNTPPTITTFPVTIGQSGFKQGIIATVSDAETPANKLKVEAVTVPAGITISFSSGITGYASISTECGTEVGARVVTLKVTDEDGLSATADLVINVTPNTPPEIRQAPAEIRIGEGFVAEIGFNDEKAANGVLDIADAESNYIQITNSVELMIDGQPVEWEKLYSFGKLIARIRLPRTGTFTLNVILRDRCGAITRKDIRLVVAGASAECFYPQFGTGRTYGLGGTGSALVTGNFNNDGRADVAVLVGAPKQVRIYTGNADGTLSLTSDFSVPVYSQSLAVADFNGDGKPDLVVGAANSTNVQADPDDGIYIFTGNGDATFSLSKSYRVGGGAIGVGDFNGDGRSDIASIEKRSVNKGRGVAILLNDGNGGFSDNPQAGLPDYYFDNSSSLAVVDYYNNSYLDLFADTGSKALPVGTLLRGDGKGGFRVTTFPGSVTTFPDYIFRSYATTIYAQSGDFNGDGKPDLAVVIGESSNPNDYWFINGLQILRGYYRGLTPRSLAAADFNLDGKQDVALDSGAIMIGKENDLFCAAPVLARGGKVASGDFNGDGKPDLIFAEQGSGNLILQLNNTVPAPNTPPTITAATNPVYVGRSTTSFSYAVAQVKDVGTAVAKLAVEFISVPSEFRISELTNDNGRILAKIQIDCGVSEGDYPAVLKVTDEGGLSATTQIIFRVGPVPRSNFSYEYRDAIVTAGSDALITPNNEVLEINFQFAFYNFKRAVITAPGFQGSLTYRHVRDSGNNGQIQINNAGPPGDYLVTMAVYDEFSGCESLPVTKQFRLRVNEKPSGGCAQPSFAAPVSYAAARVPVTGDFNGDGNTDLAFGAEQGVMVLPGDGKGGFGQGIYSDLGGQFYVSATGDFDGDGNTDLLSGLTVLFGDGAGSFTEKVTSSLGRVFTGRVVVGDLNGDGRTDIIEGTHVTPDRTGYYSVLLSNGRSGFTIVKDTAYGNGIIPHAITDFNRDGKGELIFSYEWKDVPGHRGSFSVSGIDSKGNFTFAPGTVSGIGLLLSVIATTDVNGDGRTDLVGIDAGQRGRYDLGNIKVVINDQARPITSYPSGLSVVRHGVNGDFNGDGYIDLIVLGSVSSSDAEQSIRFMAGDGHGGFVSPVSIIDGNNGTNFSSSSWLITDDFNNDGRPDLALSRTDRGDVQIFLNTCNAVTENTPPAITALPVTTNQGSLAVAAVATVSDRETRVEKLKVQTESVPTGISVYGFTNNNGTMTAWVGADCNTPPGDYTVVLKAFDLDGATNTASLTVTVATNTPPTLGAYPAEITLSSASTNISPAQVPADNGSIASLTVSAVTYSGAVSVDVNGTVTISNAGNPGRHQVTVTAVDNCGASSAQSFLIVVPAVSACERLGFGERQDYAVPRAPYAMTFGDFNGDGLTDLAVANRGANSVTILLAAHTASGITHQAAHDYPVGDDPRALAVGDFNRDGRIDMVIANRESQNLLLLFGNGDGSFATGGSMGVNMKPFAVNVEDFNRDSNADLLVAGDFSGNVALLLGDGKGSFAAPVYYAAGELPQPPIVADFNQDGHADIATANPPTGKVALLHGDGQGGFAAPVFIAAGELPGTLAAADFNGDHRVDLAVASGDTNIVRLLLNNGQGGFSESQVTNAGVYPTSLAVNDFNSDGKMDLAIGNYGEDTISVLSGDGQGGFVEAASDLFGVGSHPLSLLANDFDGDGRTDLAIVNNGSDTASVLLNRCDTAIAPELVTVSAASYKRMRLAGGAIAAAFGQGLATETRVAETLPLPVNLAGTTVKIKDSRGAEHNASLFFVSAQQVNYQIPAAAAPGMATVTLTSGNGAVRTGHILITAVAPGLFTADASGRGLPAALLLRVSGSGEQRYEAVAEYDQQQKQFVARPVAMPAAAEELFLILFGTGFATHNDLTRVKASIGGQAAEVLYAGSQGGYVGLDQVNLRLPKTLTATDECEIQLVVHGFAANPVRVMIR